MMHNAIVEQHRIGGYTYKKNYSNNIRFNILAMDLLSFKAFKLNSTSQDLYKKLRSSSTTERDKDN